MRVEQARDQGGRGHVAAGHDVPDAGEPGERMGDQLMQQPRHDVHHGHPLLADRLANRVELDRAATGEHHEPAPVGEGAEDLQRGRIEGCRRHLEEHVIRADAHPVGVADQPHDRAVRNGDALGRARRAGGVADIREVVGGDPHQVGARVDGRVGGRVGERGAGGLGDAVAVEHDRRGRGRCAGGELLGHHRVPHARVAGQLIQPGLWVVDAECQVRAAGLEHPEQGHHQLGGPGHQDGHHGVGYGASSAQLGGDTAGPFCELPIGQRPRAAAHRRRLRDAGHLPGHQIEYGLRRLREPLRHISHIRVGHFHGATYALGRGVIHAGHVLLCLFFLSCLFHIVAPGSGPAPTYRRRTAATRYRCSRRTTAGTERSHYGFGTNPDKCVPDGSERIGPAPGNAITRP